MTDPVVSEPSRLNGGIGKERAAMVVALFLFAAAIRSAIAFNGGMWADEGFFMLVIGAPSWHEMLDFLRLHESHPPFFYALMRVWEAMTGNSDTAALMLAVVIGAAIVPAIYDAGRRLFSERAGLIAATLAAISPPLVEHSAQLRPYGLLPVLALVSCTSLINGIVRQTRGEWIAYFASTVLMLYTQNWAWLVAIGQLVAVMMLLSGRIGNKPKLARKWILSWLAIGLAFLPWLSALVFQIQHAGHEPVVAHGFGDWLELAVVAVPASISMAVFGRFPASFSLGATALGIAAVAAFTLWWLRSRSAHLSSASPDSPQTLAAAADRERIATRVLLIVPAASIALAIALSARTNLLLPRCMATLSPLLLLLFASWVDRRWGRVAKTESIHTQIATGLVAGLTLAFVFGSAGLVSVPRSNVMDLVANIEINARRDDLIIVAPEWYGASFNRYFHRRLEQIDYPHPGVSGMIDFSHVFERVSDPAPLARLRRTIANAAHEDRRVWLISSRAYARNLNTRDVENAMKYRIASAFSVVRVHQIRRALDDAYGPPDTSYFVNDYKPREDELVAYLYSPSAHSSAGETRSP